MALTVALIAAAILFGGRSAGWLWGESTIQVLGAWLLAALIIAPPSDNSSRLLPAAVAITSLILLVFVIQVLPLPSAYWTELPGRDFAQAIAAATDRVNAPAPLSLNRSGTVQSALTLLAPIALFFAVAGSDNVQRRRILWIIFFFALASSILGILQFSTRGAVGNLFNTEHRIYAIGLFSNRNHAADLTIIGMLIGCYLFPGARPDLPPSVRAATFALALLAMTISLVGTQSRFGLAAGAPLAFVGAALLFPNRKARTIVVGGVAAMGGLFLALLALRPDLISSLLSRFQSVEEDARGAIWPDVLWAVQYFFPAGTGFGSFERIFPLAESLSDVTPRFVNHAHNDYLEIALEGGFIALLVFAAFSLWYAAALRSGLRKAVRRERRHLSLMAGAGTALLLAHSFFDYPLRTSSQAAVFAMLLALLVPAPDRTRSTDNRARETG